MSIAIPFNVAPDAQIEPTNQEVQTYPVIPLKFSAEEIARWFRAQCVQFDKTLPSGVLIAVNITTIVDSTVTENCTEFRLQK